MALDKRTEKIYYEVCPKSTADFKSKKCRDCDYHGTYMKDGERMRCGNYYRWIDENRKTRTG